MDWLKQVNAIKIPREPFLAHSETLLAYLCGRGGEFGGNEILELGCGRQSPFVPMLRRLWPSARLHQIDARPDVLAEAAAFNPAGIVQHMFATDMSAIKDASKDAIIAMSFFDQNLDTAVATIGREMNRLLRPGGWVLYIHNEQLNAPATSMSARFESLMPPQEKPSPNYMLPNDRWQPTNDREYCHGAVAAVDEALASLGASGLYLQRYLRTMYPDLATLGHAQASVAPSMSLDDLRHVRRTVGLLRQAYQVPFEDKSTAKLLASRVEPVIGGAAFGFETICAATFEIRKCVPWEACFRQPPPATCLARGLTAFGYSTNASPSPVAAYCQDLNDMPTRQNGEIELVGYQYGFLGRKT